MLYKTTLFGASCALALSAATGVHAIDLRSELQPIEPLLGMWSCDGINHATPEAPETEFKASFDFSPVLAGQWIKVAYTEVVSATHPVSRDNIEYWGASPDGNGLQVTFVNAFGQSGTLSGRGWEKNSVTWEGNLTTPQGPAPFKGAVSLDDETKTLVVEPSIGLPDGGWFKIATLSCRKM